MKKFLKPALIILINLLLLLTFWLLSKPFREAKAGQYLKSQTLLGYQKASVLTPLSPLVHLKIGEEYEKQGNFDVAEKEFQKIAFICNNFAWKNEKIKACPEYIRGYFNLSKIKTYKALIGGDINKAEAFLVEALELDPSDPEIKFYLGLILAAQGNYKNGIEKLFSSEAGVLRGQNLKIENSQLEQQRQILLSALKKISPSPSAFPNPYNSFLLGAAFLKMGYPNLAISQFEKAKKLEPDYRDAYMYSGLAYLHLADSGLRTIEKQEKLQKAKESLEKAAKIDPVYPDTFYLLSKTYEKLKKPAEAQEALKKAKILGWQG